MDPKAIWQAAKETRGPCDVEGVHVSLEVAMALCSLRPVEVGGEVLFSPLGALHARRLVTEERDGVTCAVLVRSQ